MVLISSKKYACETCIKGHRSSSCKHTDRPLFEIKKKGRPVTQCEHCRELRKTKQVHVKCSCEVREPLAITPSTSTKKGGTKVPASAAFPNGLPEALEASVAVQRSADTTSSDSDYQSSPSCTCKDGDICHCFELRKSVAKRAAHPITVRSPNDHSGSDKACSSRVTARSPVPTASSPTPLSILARIAELRPVLPRPTAHRIDGPIHDPSSSFLHGHARHHTHEDMFFSPYGRAYEHMHTPDSQYARSDASSSDICSAQKQQRDFAMHQRSLSVPPIPPPEQQPTWMPPADSSFPSLCGCGDKCACPGCTQHNNSNVDIAPEPSIYTQCSNPGACGFCLDCSILSLPADMPPNTALSIYDSAQTESVDEWLRQIAALPSSAFSNVPMQPSMQPNTEVPAQYQQPAWDNFQLPPMPRRATDTGERYGGCCKFASGQCDCPRDRCECRQGCGDSNGRRLTFATSGERVVRERQDFASLPSPPVDATASGLPPLRIPSTSTARQRRVPSQVNNNPDYLTVPMSETSRSRSSSTSSQSSHQSGYTSGISSEGLPSWRPRPLVPPTASAPHLPSSRVVVPPRVQSRKVSPRAAASRVEFVERMRDSPYGAEGGSAIMDEEMEGTFGRYDAMSLYST